MMKRLQAEGPAVRAIGWLAGLASALACACGDGSDGQESGDDQLTPQAYCQRSAEQACGTLAGCCSTSMEACVDAYRESCSESVSNASERGLGFDPSAAADCLEVMADGYDGCVQRPLEDERAALAARLCAEVFVPTLAPGSECSFDQACLGGEGLLGVCSAEGSCAQVPPLALGTACAGDGLGGCGSGAYCDGTCKPLRATGQSCASALECRSGWCENDLCAVTPMERICSALNE